MSSLRRSKKEGRTRCDVVRRRFGLLARCGATLRVAGEAAANFRRCSPRRRPSQVRGRRREVPTAFWSEGGRGGRGVPSRADPKQSSARRAPQWRARCDGRDPSGANLDKHHGKSPGHGPSCEGMSMCCKFIVAAGGSASQARSRASLGHDDYASASRARVVGN